MREAEVSPQLETFCDPNWCKIIQPLGNTGMTSQALPGCKVLAEIIPLDVPK